MNTKVILTAALAAAAGASATTPAPIDVRLPEGNDRGQQPGEWTLPARDYSNTRYSPLGAITTGNVANLRPMSVMATGIPNGHEGQPLVVGSTMYMVTPYPNSLLAIDLTVPGGALKWKYEPHPDPRSVGIACCDVVNRGASFADGKVIYNTLDAHTVAVDAATGKPVWNTTVGDIKCLSGTAGPSWACGATWPRWTSAAGRCAGAPTPPGPTPT
jgi:glucose dehydrogenase